MSGISKWLDFVLLIVIIAASVVILPVVFQEYSTPILQSIEDKTALDVKNALYVGNEEKTGADLLMSLVVVDEYTPYPRAIRINNTPIIVLDKSWVSSKYRNISIIYSTSGAYKLGNMLDWEITSVSYVPNNGSPYIQYILEGK